MALGLARFCVLRKNFRFLIAGFSKSLKSESGLSVENWADTASFIRNCGIIAHIDAGKTTTTERMLFYAGMIHSPGEVHHGDTVMDYLPQERERGITISSACISFRWEISRNNEEGKKLAKYRVNLIDTPGHVDFTVEVERALRVLDGAVMILDAISGVEAQSETVYRQSRSRKLPLLAFCNKMDRPDTSMWTCVESMISRLHSKPLVVQLPVSDDSSSFLGVIDLISMEFCRFSQEDTGKTVIRESLSESMLSQKAPHYLHSIPTWFCKNPGVTILEQANAARALIISQLADYDDNFAMIYLENPEMLAVGNMQGVVAIKDAIRRLTLLSVIHPVLVGSSFKNIGVQLLLDSMIDYLPSPIDRVKSDIVEVGAKLEKDSLLLDKQKLQALAFKVSYDNQKGFITFIRVYKGILRAKDSLKNITIANSKVEASKSRERALRLVEIYANEMVDIDEVVPGNIAAVLGLKHVRTGDTLVSWSDKETQALTGINVPEPVFFCSIEAESSKEESKLEEALQIICQEDPSIGVTSNTETGQMLLQGMGELHLEVIFRRLTDDYKVKAKKGKIEVAYRESISQPVSKCYSYQKSSVDKATGKARNLYAKVDFLIEPIEKGSGVKVLFDDNLAKCNLEHLNYDDVVLAINNGITSALSRGIVMGYPMTDVRVTVLNLVASGDSTLVAFTQAASMGVNSSLQELLALGNCFLLEPVMDIELFVRSDFSGAVLQDLTDRRRATILEVQTGQAGISERNKILALVPLIEMVGYSNTIRSITQGNSTFSMKYHEYQPISNNHLKKLKSL